jgi:hypothetical protein
MHICLYVPLEGRIRTTPIIEGPMTDEILTISVPEAGRRYFGLSRNGSYAAAARGEIPTIEIGRLKRVPVRALERMLDAVGQSRDADRNPR